MHARAWYCSMHGGTPLNCNCELKRRRKGPRQQHQPTRQLQVEEQEQKAGTIKHARKTTRSLAGWFLLLVSIWWPTLRTHKNKSSEACSIDSQYNFDTLSKTSRVCSTKRMATTKSGFVTVCSQEGGFVVSGPVYTGMTRRGRKTCLGYCCNLSGFATGCCGWLTEVDDNCRFKTKFAQGWQATTSVQYL